MFDKEFFAGHYIKQLNPPEDALSAALYPLSGSFFDVADYEAFAFVILIGGLDTQLTFQVHQDTSATATGDIKDIADAAVVVPADGDDKWYGIYVDTQMLDLNNGFRYVTLDVTGPTGNDYGTMLFVGIKKGEIPVTQPSSGVGSNGAAPTVVVPH